MRDGRAVAGHVDGGYRAYSSGTTPGPIWLTSDRAAFRPPSMRARFSPAGIGNMQDSRDYLAWEEGVAGSDRPADPRCLEPAADFMNLSALKSPPFRRYVASLHLALNGFWAQRVIIGWLAWDMTGSASFVGLVAFLNFFPTLFVSPLFGVFADRIDVRKGIFSYALAGACRPFCRHLHLCQPQPAAACPVLACHRGDLLSEPPHAHVADTAPRAGEPTCLQWLPSHH